MVFAGRAAAHCDSVNGPVVAAARIALQSGDVSPVLKWIQPEREQDVRTEFARTLKARAHGAEARSLADQYFFEALVRLHRAGEMYPSALKRHPMLAQDRSAPGNAFHLGSTKGRERWS